MNFNKVGGTNMDIEIREKMLPVCENLKKMLALSFDEFRRPAEKSFKEAEEVKDKLLHDSSEFTSFVISKSPSTEKGREWAKPYLSIASSLDRMTHNIEGILDRLRTKSQKHLLFSDQAVKEVNDIFQEAMRLLELLPNLVATGDKLLAQRMGEEGRAILKIANGYSERHEERLIQGICVPKSSPVYLGIIESLKGVMIHILEVSGKIVSLSTPVDPRMSSLDP
jgi:Na+/phosphate symporter